MAFSGYAPYSESGAAFDDVAESVAAVITNISPHEAPFLDAIGDAMAPAKSIRHEFMQDELSPNRVVLGGALASNATGADAIAIGSGLGRYLQVGMMLSGPESAPNSSSVFPEYFQITGITSPGGLTVQRAFTGTLSTSLGSGQILTVISDASLDAADVTVDTSRPRTHLENYCHLIKKDIKIAGVMSSLEMLGGIGTGELGHQIRKKMLEAVRDLEKLSIRSRLSLATIGSGTATRTMKGLLQWLESYTDTYTTTVGSPITTFETNLLDSVEKAWQAGGTDLDLMVCGPKLKRQIDQLNQSRIRIIKDDPAYGNVVWEFNCGYGDFKIMLNRWMPAAYCAFVSTSRIKMAPLQKREFRFKPVAHQGDWDGGYVLGDYTMELRNAEGMRLARFPNLGDLITP